ncbi:MAG: pili assembly chaperone [Gammaproteobacteria bacterium]|nr:pili assembly chaperone [Gammaproteobacteria bacterium]
MSDGQSIKDSDGQSTKDTDLLETNESKIKATDVVALDPMTLVGRYTLISATPTEQQIEPLSVMVTVTMPKLIQTVGDAIRHVLKPSGYRLARLNAQGPEVIQLLGRPLPQIHRKLGPMPLQDILLTLVSPAFRLHTDPVHRLIAYDLKNDYMEEFAP